MICWSADWLSGATGVGSVSLVVRRRKVKAKRHLGLVQSKNEDLRYSIQLSRDRVRPCQRRLRKTNRVKMALGFFLTMYRKRSSQSMGHQLSNQEIAE